MHSAPNSTTEATFCQRRPSAVQTSFHRCISQIHRHSEPYLFPATIIARWTSSSQKRVRWIKAVISQEEISVLAGSIPTATTIFCCVIARYQIYFLILFITSKLIHKMDKYILLAVKILIKKNTSTPNSQNTLRHKDLLNKRLILLELFTLVYENLTR